MTDDADKELPAGQVPGDKERAGPLAGERLATARREQQITVLEVAKELHLDEPKVRALEQNDFGMLGAPVFAKGHLRKYATLVGVDPDDVLHDYYQLTRAQGVPPVVGRVRKPVREISPGPWLVAIAALILAALAYWWFVARDAGPDVSRPQPALETFDDSAADNEVASSPVELSVPQESSLPAVVAEETVVTEADNEPAPEPEPAADPEIATSVVASTVAPTVVSGELRLSMSFSGECWTEVTDANGRRLFFDLGRAGRTVNVSGEAPLSVLFGNADNVSVQVNGDDYAIQATDRRGETARFTVLTP